MLISTIEYLISDQLGDRQKWPGTCEGHFSSPITSLYTYRAILQDIHNSLNKAT